jgi:hypothetical protein
MNPSKKRTKMKKAKFAFLLSSFFLLSCSSSYYWKKKIEIPSEPILKLDNFKEIVITDFIIKKETKDFDLNREIVDYFTSELAKEFEGKVYSIKVPLEKEEMLKDEKFWKAQGENLKETLLISGSAQYTEEVRKAILKRRKDAVDDPFRTQRGLAQRKFYTFLLDLYLIDPKTGSALYNRSFKESQSYENPKQTAHFAFFDLIQRVKTKFFQNILAEARIQERYLISK